MVGETRACESELPYTYRCHKRKHSADFDGSSVEICICRRNGFVERGTVRKDRRAVAKRESVAERKYSRLRYHRAITRYSEYGKSKRIFDRAKYSASKSNSGVFAIIIHTTTKAENSIFRTLGFCVGR